MNLKLSHKLIIACLGLVIIPLLVMGGVSLWSLTTFSKNVTQSSVQALSAEGQQMLSKGNKIDGETILNYLAIAESDVRALAQSGNVLRYSQAMEGKSQEFNQASENTAKEVVNNILRLCKMHHNTTTSQLSKNLAMTESMLAKAGGASLSASTVNWLAINQLTKQSHSETLPSFQLGATPITQNKSFETRTPLVDEVTQLCGSSCTLFQRMNEEGDMLRVATSVKQDNGERAIGTFIPAKNGDGSSNPIIEAALKGAPFQGRAYVVNAWYVTAYTPLKNPEGKVIGMLFVGIQEQDNEILSKAIADIKIGTEGYIFVMDKKGTLVIHPKKELIGKNTITDLKLANFQTILDGKTSEQPQMLNYRFEEREKFIAYQQFPAWEWIVCASGYWADMSRLAADRARSQMTEEMANFYRIASLNNKPIYPQIRYLDAKGNEIVVINNGRIETKLGSRSSADWFKKACQLPLGQIGFSRVEIALNTGEPELRLSTPVYVDSKLAGLAVLNVDWRIYAQLVCSRVYGKTGYPYIINDAGELVAHPKYSLKDHKNLSAPENGYLAGIIKNRMIKGEDGSDDYVFEGVHKRVQFSPLKIGEFSYSLAATCPTAEFMALANSIKADSTTQTKRANRLMIAVWLVMSLLGGFIGLLISRNINSVLKRISGALSSSAAQTAASADQVYASSQSLAEGASEQAASLEETSSSLEQMASMTRRNAESAIKAKELADNTKATAETGARHMQSMSQAMEKIETSSNEMSSAMSAVKASNSEVAKIIKTIDEIAFQTNILALNAAVEAARAGEAGSGFAVVADEVRNLAQKSAAAARETASKIEIAIGRTDAGVRVSEKVVADLKTVTAQSQQVKSSLKEIEDKSNAVDGLVAEIATASQEQSLGIEQVNKAVSQMDKVTQSTASSAEESAGASAELKAQAKSLHEAVQDLVTLIGGQTAQAVSVGKQPAMPPRSQPNTARKNFAAAQSPQTISSSTALPQKSPVKPTLPMEQDFRDF